MLGQDVVRVAEDMRHQVIALSHDDLDVTDPARVERMITRERPGAVINCAAWTDVDGAEESERGGVACQRAGRRLRRRRGRQGRRQGHLPLDRLRLQRRRRALRRVGRSRADQRLRAHEAGRRAGHRAGQRAAASSSAPPGCSARTAGTSSRRCCASARAAGRWSSSTTRSAAPPTRATWRSGCCA